MKKSTMIFDRRDVDNMVDITQVIEDYVNNTKMVKCMRVYNFSTSDSQIFMKFVSLCKLDDPIHKTTGIVELVDLSKNIVHISYSLFNDDEDVVVRYDFDTHPSSTTNLNMEGYIDFDTVKQLFDSDTLLDGVRNLQLNFDKTKLRWLDLTLEGIRYHYDLTQAN